MCCATSCRRRPSRQSPLETRERPMRLAHAAMFAGALAPCAWADPPPEVMKIVREADLKWVTSPFYPGLSSAIIQGDPREPGVYIQRNRFSPGTFSFPHFHPETRYIVVLKGT